MVTLKLTLWPINSGVLIFLLLSHLSSSPTDSLPSLNLLCHSKTHARFMQEAPKAIWSILYASVTFFPSLKQNFIAYRSSKVSSRPDCIFEIHQLWQSGFSRVYSNCSCSCSFEAEIIKIGQLSHKMYSNNILNFQKSTTRWCGGIFESGRSFHSTLPLSVRTVSPRNKYNPFWEMILLSCYTRQRKRILLGSIYSLALQQCNSVV